MLQCVEEKKEVKAG